MEKANKKYVDRQATFDTDPHRANLTHGNLKLPIIEAQELEKRKSALRENRNKQAKISNKSPNDQKETIPVNNPKTRTTEKDTNTTVPAVKNSELDKKSNILSNINKKVVIAADKDSKEIKKSKDTLTKSAEEPLKSLRNPNGIVKTDKSGIVHSDQKAGVDKKSNDSSKAAILNKVNETKSPAGNSKSEASLKTSNVNNKVTQSSNKTVKESEVGNKTKVNDSRSRSPEKQTAKASVLKDLNQKRSLSPTKGRNASPTKEIKSTKVDESPNTKTSKTVVTNSQNKTTNKNDLSHSSSPRKQENISKDKAVHKQVENKSPSYKTDKNQNDLNIVKDRIESKSPPKSTLPTNKAPAETKLVDINSEKVEKASSKVTPRTKPQTIKQTTPVDQNTRQTDSNKETNENAKQYYDNSAFDAPKSNHTVDTSVPHLNSSAINNNQGKVHEEHIVNQSEGRHDFENPPTDSKAVSNAKHVDKARSPAERVLNSSVQSKNETYVLSPSPTKLDSRLQRGNKVSRAGRLSPSNESVEPIRLEQRPAQDRSAMDGKESYAQVYAERNTLLNAEYTYRKRIKQLEDEANGFLKAIDELTTENKYLRNRVDTLEDELRGKGDQHAINKISELEKDKTELENKIKQLEKTAKSYDNADELRELKEQIVKLQSENQTVNEENMKLKSENYENTKKLHKLETEKKSLETSVTDVESEKLGKIQDLNNETKQMGKQLNDLKTKNKGFEKKIDALEYENKMLSETLAQKKTELGELLGVMKDENRFDDEIKDLKNEILKLNKEKKESDIANNKEKRILNEKLKDVKASLDTKSRYADELKIKLDQVESEHKKIKSDFDPMKRLVESQKKEIARLKEENERLKQELKESKEQFLRLESETGNASKELKETKEQLEKFNKELQKIVNDKESQISKLINQLDTMRQERENDRKTAQEEKEQLASEMEKVESYQSTTKRLEEDLKHFSEKLDESKLREKQLSLQLEDKSFEVSNLEHQVFEMNMKVENYTKRMTELDRDKREMEREKREWEVKKDKIDDIEASNKRLLEENKRLRNQLEMSSYSSSHRSSDRGTEEKPVLEAWVGDKVHPQTINHAIYVQKEKERDHKKKKVYLAQPGLQKKRIPYSKSSPVKISRQHKSDEHKTSNPSTHRSLEDLRKAVDTKSPESEHSLPELKRDAHLTMGYGSLAGYRQIHKDRIRAAHKRVY